MMFQAESDQMIKLSATLNMSVWSVIWAVFYCAATAGNQPLGITLPVVAFATLGLISIAWPVYRAKRQAIRPLVNGDGFYWRSV